MIALSGDVKAMTVPWFFQNLRVGKKTGTALFENTPAVKKVYFKNGDIIFASSNLDGDRLGECLLRAGKITKAQYDASAELLKKTKKKQGAILVEIGAIAPQDLVAGVKLQVKEILESLFAWNDGSYRFDGSPLPVADIIPLQMSTGNVILEGLRALDWKLIRKLLPPLKTVIRPVTDPTVLFQSADLTPDQRTVFAAVDGKRSIETLCADSGVGDYNTLTAVYLLLALRMAEVGEIKSEEERSFARDAVNEAVKPAMARKAGCEGPEGPATRESVIAAYEALGRQNHYQVLDIGNLSSAQDVKSAYLCLAKRYHPDRHFEASMLDLKDKLEALFNRCHEAYMLLSNQTKRAAYDLELATTERQPAQTPGAPRERAEHYHEKAAQAKEHFENGMKQFTAGDYWSAVEAFTWAVRLDPVTSKYFFQLGRTLAHIPRRRHESEENLKKAIELDPFIADYHFELGALYVKTGLKTKALERFNNALRLDPASDKIKEAILAAGGGDAAPREKEGVLKKLFKKG